MGQAYTVKIDPFGSGALENNSINQTSPAWVLTFIRWAVRDTLRTALQAPLSPLSVRHAPVVVENDCISVSVTHNKGNLTQSVNAVLVMTDINYATDIAPGDFMFVNMLNWDKDARRVADAARSLLPINGVNDGFKGFFKVQSIRRLVTTDARTGITTVLFRITGYSHTEFNNSIYFNPYIIDPNQDYKNQLLFASNVGNDWRLLINLKGLNGVQDIISVLIQSFIGNGIDEQGRIDKNGDIKSPNVHFFMPSVIGNLLGVSGTVTAAKDVYVYLFGIQHYAGGVAQSLSDGLNPTGLYSKLGKIYYTGLDCQGKSLLKPEYWNQVKTWDILNQYTNAPLNELYTCFRVDQASGRVMPTVVFRQIPFTNEDYQYGGTVTRFMTIPRWKINPALVFEQDIGTDESARINFVQFFGRTTLGVNGADVSIETAANNYLYDINDVQRSGLRPYVVSTQFDDPTTQVKDLQSPVWAKIVGDCLIGGHLKTNGTMVVAGIVQPIAVGDNFEFDGTVYHIEQLVHSCEYDVINGDRTFRTIISLSNGLDISSNSNGTRFPEFSYPNAYALRQHDAKNNAILPGISESQDVVYRKINPDVDDRKQNPKVPSSPNSPFIQPNTQKGGQIDDGSDT